MSGQQLLAALQQLPAELLALPIQVAWEDVAEEAACLVAITPGNPGGEEPMLVIGTEQAWFELPGGVTIIALRDYVSGPLDRHFGPRE